MSILGKFANYLTLGQNINKANMDTESMEGVVSQPEEEFTLKISDEELIVLKKQWEASWSKYSGKIVSRQDKNESYYLGKSFGISDLTLEDNPVSDNMIFEAVETSIPQYTSENPEPVVLADNTEVGNKLASDIKGILLSKADTLHLKLKMKKAVRMWHLYFTGCFKVVWDEKINDFNIHVIRPKKLILDPDGVIEGAEFLGKYIGEVKQGTARDMIDKFPKKKEIITSVVGDKLGTLVQWKEWWTDEFVFWTWKDEVLDKANNPHWNEEREDVLTDVFGLQEDAVVPGNNHFTAPKKPYVFISVFSLDTQPHDETNLVEQNLATQDRINKKEQQIDANIDGMNGGWAVSGDAFTKEQASDVANTLNKPNGYIWVPTGPVSNAVQRYQPSGLPADVYNQLDRDKQTLRSNFGITGFTPQGTASEETVRGKILVRGQDQNRATTVSEALEQAYDSLYNWMIQMMFVYYDQAHTIPILGPEKGTEILTIHSSDFVMQLDASIKPGSMIPKDPLTQANQAIDLWSASAIDPESLFRKLDFPDPQSSAKKLFQWMTNPASLFPDVPPAQPVQEPGAGAIAPVEGSQGLDLPVDSPDLLSNIPIQ